MAGNSAFLLPISYGREPVDESTTTIAHNQSELKKNSEESAKKLRSLGFTTRREESYKQHQLGCTEWQRYLNGCVLVAWNIGAPDNHLPSFFFNSPYHFIFC